MARESLNAHLYPSDFVHESRMLKESDAVVRAGLADRALVGATWSAGLSIREDIDGRREVRRFRTLVDGSSGGRFTKILGHMEWTARVFVHLLGLRSLSIVTCHSLTTLPIGVAVRAVRRCVLVYSPHELETETAQPPLPVGLSRFIERRLIGFADGVIVVGDKIAEWYAESYGIDDVAVVRNVPRRSLPTGGSGPNRENALRTSLGIDEDDLLFLYQGGFFTGRAIEMLLDVWKDVPADRHLVFLGYGQLADEIERRAKSSENIHRHDAVPPDELAAMTAGADVGVSVIENVSLSYYYSLPNKVFEYMHAGIPVIVSDFPEVSKVVDSTDFGWKVDVDPASILELVTNIDRDEVAEKAENAVRAQRTFDWDSEESALRAAYERAIERRGANRMRNRTTSLSQRS